MRSQTRDGHLLNLFKMLSLKGTETRSVGGMHVMFI